MLVGPRARQKQRKDDVRLLQGQGFRRIAFERAKGLGSVRASAMADLSKLKAQTNFEVVFVDGSESTLVPEAVVGENKPEDDEKGARGDQDLANFLLSRRDPLFPNVSQWSHLLKWSKISAVAAGYVNLGNTCFMNAVLQCLTYLPALAQLCLEEKQSAISLKRVVSSAKNTAAAQGKQNRFCALSAVVKHLNVMHTMARDFKQKNQALSPDIFVKNLHKLSNAMRVGRQQDAHEFLRLLLANMQESCALAHGFSETSTDRRLETSAIMQLFGGVIESRLECGLDSCLAVQKKFEPFMDIALHVADSSVRSVEDALQVYLSKERLDEDNQWSCSTCGKHSRAIRELRLHLLPNHLVLHLKRFGFGKHGQKLDKHLAFEREIDLARFVQNRDGESCKYVLSSVVVHEGASLNFGHYIAFVRAPNGIWYEMDDELVRRTKFSEVKKQNAYLLFFTREESSQNVVSENKVVRDISEKRHEAPELNLSDFARNFDEEHGRKALTKLDLPGLRKELFGNFIKKRQIPLWLRRCYLKEGLRTGKYRRQVFIECHLRKLGRKHKVRIIYDEGVGKDKEPGKEAQPLQKSNLNDVRETVVITEAGSRLSGVKGHEKKKLWKGFVDKAEKEANATKSPKHIYDAVDIAIDRGHVKKVKTKLENGDRSKKRASSGENAFQNASKRKQRRSNS